MIERDGSRMRVSGRLTMDSIGSLFADAMQPLEGVAWTIDMAGVESADSAAVSLMLSWLRQARRNRATLSFINVPENLRALAALYGVADMLALNAPAQ